MADKVLYEEMIDFLDAVSAADDNGRKKKKRLATERSILT